MSRLLLIHIPRVLLGLIFLVGAIEGFTFILTGNHLIHPPTSEEGAAFEAALHRSGFLWPLMKTVELIAAFCLLSNRAPAFGLALVMPIMAVIVLFHAVLNPAGLPIALLLIAAGALLLFAYRDRSRPLFS
jgi:putative oxidoreductase